MVINSAFTGLPLRAPEPCLLRRHWHHWPKLDHPVWALTHLELGAGAVKVVTTPEVCWQRNRAA